jgi:hypothetical protein
MTHKMIGLPFFLAHGPSRYGPTLVLILSKSAAMHIVKASLGPIPNKKQGNYNIWILLNIFK